MPSVVVDEIKQRLDIVQVMGEYMRLTKVGPNFRGLCPFHNEKTPSFHLDYYKGLWHCFGCGKGGDLFTFVQEMERLDFPATLKMLAKKAGVTLPENNSYASVSTQVYEIIDEAAHYYEKNLWQPLGKNVLDYLKERGLTEEFVRVFHLGLSLNNWDSLYLHLRQKNYSDEDIIKAGLCLRTSKGTLIDRFRHRLMFPLRNQHNQVIAFAGRRLNDAEPNEAKYVNSADSPYYHKGEILYNYYLARQERPEFIVVVEGYMDAIMSYQAGLKNVMAVSGTALTPRQAVLLSRTAPKVILAFDNDEAGEAATLKSLPALLGTDLEIKILNLTSAKDAGELVAKDPTAWLEAVQNSQNYLEVLLSRQAKKFSGDPEAGRKIAQSLLPILGSIADPLKLAHNIKIVAASVSLPTAAIEQAVKNHRLALPQEPVAVVNKETDSEISFLRFQNFLRALMLYPEGFFACPPDLEQAFLGHDLGTLYIDLKTAYNAYKTEGTQVAWPVYLRKSWQGREEQYAFLFVNLEEEPTFAPAQIFIMSLKEIYLPYLKQVIANLKNEADQIQDATVAQEIVGRLSQLQQLYHRYFSQL